ncbi:hypothetical protein EDB80DRAFT_813574, partial [Ilyonectria destructans]
WERAWERAWDPASSIQHGSRRSKHPSAPHGHEAPDDLPLKDDSPSHQLSFARCANAQALPTNSLFLPSLASPSSTSARTCPPSSATSTSRSCRLSPTHWFRLGPLVSSTSLPSPLPPKHSNYIGDARILAAIRLSCRSLHLQLRPRHLCRPANPRRRTICLAVFPVAPRRRLIFTTISHTLPQQQSWFAESLQALATWDEELMIQPAFPSPLLARSRNKRPSSDRRSSIVRCFLARMRPMTTSTHTTGSQSQLGGHLSAPAFGCFASHFFACFLFNLERYFQLRHLIIPGLGSASRITTGGP